MIDVSSDVDEIFDIWSFTFCFFVGDDGKKDKIFFCFEEFDFINFI
jgi:hypothetical protein